MSFTPLSRNGLMVTGINIAIDLSAAAAPIAREEVTRWAAGQRMFISSVIAGMHQLRQAAADTIAHFGGEPVWFEDFGGRDDPPEVAYLAEVATSTIYVGLLGARYGDVQQSGRSVTHDEYREAERRGLRISVWRDQTASMSGHQRDFLQEIRVFHTTGDFDGADDLARRLGERLERIAREDLSPWCKLGDAVFRAARITDNGKRIRVTASIHDRSVLTAIEGLRPGGWGAKQSRLTWAGHSRAVLVKRVETTTTAARAAGLDIELDVNEMAEVRPIGAQFSLDGRHYTPDDVTEAELRRTLFDEALPGGLLKIGRRVPDTISRLWGLSLADEVLRPLVSLILTETLVGGGLADSVGTVRLSPARDGRRRLRLEWHGTKPGGRRLVEGLVEVSSVERR